MSLQPYPRNPIEKRKAEVRRYSRNAVVSVGGGVAVALAGFVIFHSSFLIIFGLVLAVLGGASNAMKVKKIVDHKDNY